MKVLFITARYYPDGAGAGKSIRNLAQYLTAKGHDVTVIRIANDGKYLQEICEGVKIHHLPMRNIYGLTPRKRPAILKLLWHVIDAFNPLAMRDIARILDIEQPDIVNTNVISGFSAAIFTPIKRRNIPLVHTLRDYYLLCTQSGMFAKGKACDGICTKCKPFIPMRRFWARHVDMFLANSDYVLQRHRHFGMIRASQSAQTVLNMNACTNTNTGMAVAPPRKLPSQSSRQSPHHPIRFGFIGRLHRVKGIENLLTALSLIPSNNAQNWTLTIAGRGDPSYEAELNARIKIHPNAAQIEMIGHVNADDFYPNIDVLICPSIYAEPLPRVIYEAYAHALPVISSDAGGSPEIVDDGQTGLLYPAQDPQALAQHMTSFITNPDIPQTMSINAAYKAKDFTPDCIGETYLNAITPLLAQRDQGNKSERGSDVKT